MFDPVGAARRKLNAFMVQPHALTTGPLEGWTNQIARLNTLAQQAHDRAEAARRRRAADAIPLPVPLAEPEDDDETDVDDIDDEDDGAAAERTLTGGRSKKPRTKLRAPRKASGSKPQRPKQRRSKK